LIAVVDYGLGNLASVRNALRAAGASPVLTADPHDLARADGIVLPGVGAAAAGMENLRARGLESPLRDLALSGTPLLGLCLGMQLLFTRSEEGNTSCLDLLQGTVRRLRGPKKVPQIGWNEVEPRKDCGMWAGMPPRPYFYFVHSYVCEPEDEDVIAGMTDYGVRFCSAVTREKVWGTQFHPERSGGNGLRLLRAFVDLCAGRSLARSGSDGITGG
jgi:glutamine amidotransferase